MRQSSRSSRSSPSSRSSRSSRSALFPAAAAVVAFGLTSTHAPHARAQAPSDAVERAWEYLESASSDASAGRWDKALEEYKASNQVAPSVVALEGIAKAHDQLGHDEEALAAYRELLALNPEMPEGKPEVKRDWERLRLGAQQRVRELEARRSAAAQKAPESKASRGAPEPERDEGSSGGGDDEEVRTAKNSVFAEVLGNGLIYSINYERLFESPDVGVRVGASYMSLGASGNDASSKVTWLGFPVVASYYVGGENHKLQIGAGVNLVYVTASAQSGSLVGSGSGLIPMPTGVVGYRYIPAKGGFAFSIGFTPIFVTGPGGGFLPWGGMSLGAVL